MTGICLAIVGCSRGPTAVGVPSFDPEGSAARAMELYDKNSDGLVADDELQNAPSLKATIKNLDADSDGKVSEAEIIDRISAWEKMSIGLMNFSCTVTMDGQPLEGATLTFEPEEFLGGVIQSAIGVTSSLGTASPKIPKENRPSPDSPPGIQAGLYKVRISKLVGGQETIPPRYNVETILGQQVSKDDDAITNKRVVFNLVSK